MAEESAKLRIPYIAAAQAQKHVTHNEAMTLLDTLVQLGVIDKDLTGPPGAPGEGDCYIVAGGGGTATGAWEGWENRVARFIDGEWRSYLPGEGGAGWLAWVIDEDLLYVFDGTAWEPAVTFAVAGGFVGLQNGKIVESHASNAATFALKTLAGADPSVGDSVLAIFHDGTQLTITAALSITVPSTATLGVSNGVAFNVWIALVDDAGTPRLAVRNCSDTAGVAGFPPNGILSATAIDTGADSAKVTYSDGAVTAKPYVLAGYANYESGLATAGAWAASPTRMVQFGPGTPKPGDEVQKVVSSIGNPNDTTTSTSFVATSTTHSITPTSAANPIWVEAFGTLYKTGDGFIGRARLSRGTTNNTNMIGNTIGVYGTGATTVGLGGSLFAFDKPNVAGSPQAYAVQIRSNNASSTTGWADSNETFMRLTEVMG